MQQHYVKTFFTETCEGMLSLNNDKIRPEVACATPLGGKDYTLCNIDKRITFALLDAQTTLER